MYLQKSYSIFIGSNKDFIVWSSIIGKLGFLKKLFAYDSETVNLIKKFMLNIIDPVIYSDWERNFQNEDLMYRTKLTLLLSAATNNGDQVN
jgi:hypothetical protein